MSLANPGPSNLPIEPVLTELTAALGRGHALLQAPTGSGKSTRAPLALLDADWLAERRILMLEPRRAAARLTAKRMADVLGERLGETVGYQVRFERKIGPMTRIEVLTEGILTRRIQSDPELEGVGLVIFDELHELNLPSELGLALCLDVCDNLREDLRLLAMSATLDSARVADVLGGAAVIQGEGRSFPVDIRYAERQPDPDAALAVADAARRALDETDGNLLCFLPGVGEIGRCVEWLRNRLGDRVEVLALHGSLPGEQQDRALGEPPAERRRILVATDIAETSVTIPGIGVVIDSGLTRKPRFEPGSGLTRLVTESVSLASADQRAGRAGRLGPGVCYRLWTKAQEHGRPGHRPAEMLQADLAPLVLDLLSWGVRDPADLRWITPPPQAPWNQARDLLQRLGAIDDGGALTALGRRMAELPIHPRLAAMLLAAAPEAKRLAADLCALLSERDPRLRERGTAADADLGQRLQALAAWRAKRSPRGYDRRRLATIERTSTQLLRLVAKPQGQTTRGRKAEGPALSDAEGLLLSAYPDRLAQRRAGSNRYLLANGSGADLQLDDALSVHAYLVIASLDARNREGRIQLALPIGEQEIRHALGERIEQGLELGWDSAREAVAARESERFGAIRLSERQVGLDAQDPVAELLLDRVRATPERALSWNDSARQVQARIALLRRQDPEGPWPDLSDEHLLASLEDWLPSWLNGLTRLSEVRALDLAAILTERLDWPLRQRLDQEAPQSVETPSGNRHRLDYSTGELPVLAVPLQEMLGAAEGPSVARGRVPVLLHLLSPARRPIQVTRDLAGFWAGSYAEVRKEMRGRYPKHHWPEDPANATPMRRSLKSRGRGRA